MKALHAALFVGIPLLLGCPGFGNETIDQIPANPTYDLDVKPILDSSCILCHVIPPQQGAPNGMRLDQYDDDVDGNQGAFTSRFNIQNRGVDQSNMPPANRPPLTQTEKAILDRWVDNGAPRS